MRRHRPAAAVDGCITPLMNKGLKLECRKRVCIYLRSCITPLMNKGLKQAEELRGENDSR